MNSASKFFILGCIKTSVSEWYGYLPNRYFSLINVHSYLCVILIDFLSINKAHFSFSVFFRNGIYRNPKLCWMNDLHLNLCASVKLIPAVAQSTFRGLLPLPTGTHGPLVESKEDILLRYYLNYLSFQKTVFIFPLHRLQ